ncbi:FadR/GntR family transcriptional regulator [Aquibacillus saliphilus]|uniref:FadR/GntR family transcriptional regulator n=1 Tax=Aquibacillus saliphilus TaxID=1909422 RepID=UPI001CF00BB7|nr:GntR family transcriptional regulator [Aquibacillus saliphilus]
MSSKTKVYEEVLNQIRNFINENELSPGDRLPSERELSEQLNAGRSSVREGLRAMELLGLIETRRGEGTFLSSYRPHHTVELLSAFILQEPKIKKDILLAKRILEKEATKMAFSRVKNGGIEELSSVLSNGKINEKQRHSEFFIIIFQHAENHLLQKIWQLMEDFSYTIEKNSYNSQFYSQLIETINAGKYETIEGLFDYLYN